MRTLTFDLERELRSSAVITKKVVDPVYAQNLYAALCNTKWQKTEVWPTLKDEFWSCTWRKSGGIVADLRNDGDYMDWYCSGIGSDLFGAPKIGPIDVANVVREGIVTEEIARDLALLGWRYSPYNDNDDTFI